MDLGLTDSGPSSAAARAGSARRSRRSSPPRAARSAIAARASDRLDAQARRIGGHAIPADLAEPGRTGRRGRDAVDGSAASTSSSSNSGGPPGGTFDDLDEATWTVAIDGVLHAALRLIRAGLPHLRASAAPAILIVLSSSVREPIPGLTTSNVLRPGLAGLIKSLTAEIAPIRINGIAPGRVATPRIAHLDGLRAEATGRPLADIEREQIATDPARPLRRPGRGRSARGVPPVAGGELHQRRDRAGRRRA